MTTPHRPALAEAIAFARQHETPWPRDPAGAAPHGGAAWGVHHGDPPPYNRLRGPVHARGPQSGVIWQHGLELATWGEPARADLCFSVAKTALALLAGLAQADGLLPDVDAPVAARLPGIGFDSAHNRPITWRHLLQQTSEWQGSCFGLPDTVDRWRTVAHDPRPAGGPKGGARPLQAPGTYWEYNDVRINQLALALLHLFGQALHDVFLHRILQPLGGGDGFAWRGYDDAWVTLPGPGQARLAQSVPGGSHWGGGLSVSSHDLARLGQLVLDGGAIGGKPVLAPGWTDWMAQPCPIAPFYGGLVWLNPGRCAFPFASASSLFMQGAGGHTVWVEPALDAVVVTRWLDAAHHDAVLAALSAALSA